MTELEQKLNQYHFENQNARLLFAPLISFYPQLCKTKLITEAYALRLYWRHHKCMCQTQKKNTAKRFQNL